MTADFSPKQPFLIAFSVMDDICTAKGGVPVLTLAFGHRLAWLLSENELAARRESCDQQETFHVADFAGASLTISLAHVERHAAREQWRLHFATTPNFHDLEPHQRGALTVLHALTAELLIAAEETEDVEAAAVS